MAFELPEVVAELVQAVLFRGKLECGNHGRVNLFGRPAADSTAVMQKNFQKPDDPCVVEFDAGIADRTDGEG